jgi:predicted nucleic acid-binding protein
MYAGGADHPLRLPSLRLLEHVAAGRVRAVTSAEVIQEILHRFTALDRRDVGAVMAEQALDLFAPVLPVTHTVMQRMPGLTRRYPALAARDLVHVATCLSEGLETIVSTDRGFDRVAGIVRVDPADPAAMEALSGEPGVGG